MFVIVVKDYTAIYQIFELSLCCCWVHFDVLDFSRTSNTLLHTEAILNVMFNEY